MGLPRLLAAPAADLQTIWLTPYPVLTNYAKLCGQPKVRGILKPFGGGSYKSQGSQQSGFITSGYRSEIINGNIKSPHRYGFALDFIVTKQMAMIGQEANRYFARVGFYPEQAFIHVDLAPDIWISKENKARYWVMIERKYHYFDYIEDAADMVENYFDSKNH